MREKQIGWKAKYEELWEKHCALLEIICEDDLEEYLRQFPDEK